MPTPASKSAGNDQIVLKMPLKPHVSPQASVVRYGVWTVEQGIALAAEVEGVETFCVIYDRKGMKAVIIMATPCAESLGGGSGGYKKQ